MATAQNNKGITSIVAHALREKSGYFIEIDNVSAQPGVIEFHQFGIPTKYVATILPSGANGNYAVELKAKSPHLELGQSAPPGYIEGANSIDSGIEVESGHQSSDDIGEKIASILLSGIKFGPEQLKEYKTMYMEGQHAY